MIPMPTIHTPRRWTTRADGAHQRLSSLQLSSFQLSLSHPAGLGAPPDEPGAALVLLDVASSESHAESPVVGELTAQVGVSEFSNCKTWYQALQLENLENPT